MRRIRSACLAAIAVVAVAACAPAARDSGGPSDATDQGALPRPTRTLTGAIRIEPTYVAAKALVPGGLTLGSTIRIFNAGLTIFDDRGSPRPYLAETLPDLNTPSWQVFTDGRMETTYRLKQNLHWHNGVPLSAQDFAFSWRVYTHPEFGIASSAPQGLVDEVLAPDDRTVVLRWKRPYPFAGQIEAAGQRNLPPLPRHLLEAPFGQLTADAFVAQPYWKGEYVGLGPYKMEGWEPGAFFEASAFDGHALGRPRIDRLRVLFITDANTALAGILSGSMQLMTDDAIYFQQAVVLKREWAGNQAGVVLVAPGLWRFTQVQLHPDRVNPRALLDVRVRKALAYGLDKQAINDGIYEGEGINSDAILPPTVDYYAAVDRAVIKYPFDPRRSEQLMAEAGFTKQADGSFTTSAEGRLSFELKVIQNAQNEGEQAIMASVWRRVGFEVREAVLPAAQALDGQIRSAFPGVFTSAGPLGESTLPNFGTQGTPRPENRWNGSNRSSWTNSEYDRLADAYNTTLNRDERIQQIARMVAIFSEELPAIAINFNPWITAHVGELTGPAVTSPESSPTWNIHEWELR